MLTDTSLSDAVTASLEMDPRIPDSLEVTDGWVTLTGDVGYEFQSDAAFGDVASLYGVLGVTNEIIVENP